ncbi:MAG: hypothetical protein ACYSSN_07240 [Planctomycetota bacterium]|jgi:hypothetical protein
MKELSEPDNDLVSRVTNKVRFEDRLIGYRIRERAGAFRTTLYSFEEVVHLLNDKLPQLNLKQLQKWIRMVIRDEDLADRIAETIEQKNNDLEKVSHVRMLMGERLCQCKKAVH